MTKWRWTRRTYNGEAYDAVLNERTKAGAALRLFVDLYYTAYFHQLAGVIRERLIRDMNDTLLENCSLLAWLGARLVGPQTAGSIRHEQQLGNQVEYGRE